MWKHDGGVFKCPRHTTSPGRRCARCGLRRLRSLDRRDAYAQPAVLLDNALDVSDRRRLPRHRPLHARDAFLSAPDSRADPVNARVDVVLRPGPRPGPRLDPRLGRRRDRDEPLAHELRRRLRVARRRAKVVDLQFKALDRVEQWVVSSE